MPLSKGSGSKLPLASKQRQLSRSAVEAPAVGKMVCQAEITATAVPHAWKLGSAVLLPPPPPPRTAGYRLLASQCAAIRSAAIFAIVSHAIY